MLISDVARLLCLNKTVVIKLLQLLLHCSLGFFSKLFYSLFDTILIQDSIIVDNVGCWSGLNKVGDETDNVGIGLGKIVEVTGTYNQVALSYGAPIGSSIIVVDGGRIT